jgi:DNA ligase-1
MMGYTDGKSMPSPERYEALIAGAQEGVPEQPDEGQPYPFFLAHQLDLPPSCFSPRSARWPTGWWNGSTTASAARWSSGPARCGSGRAAKSW